MPKDVHDCRDEEDKNARGGEEECRTDEKRGYALALRCRRRDAERHDERLGDGFKELHVRADLILGGQWEVESGPPDGNPATIWPESERYKGNAADG